MTTSCRAAGGRWWCWCCATCVMRGTARRTRRCAARPGSRSTRWGSAIDRHLPNRSAGREVPARFAGLCRRGELPRAGRGGGWKGVGVAAGHAHARALWGRPVGGLGLCGKSVCALYPGCGVARSATKGARPVPLPAVWERASRYKRTRGRPAPPDGPSPCSPAPSGALARLRLAADFFFFFGSSVPRADGAPARLRLGIQASARAPAVGRSDGGPYPSQGEGGLPSWIGGPLADGVSARWRQLDVADNINLSTVVSGYEEFYQSKYGRRPKLMRRLSGDFQVSRAPSAPRRLCRLRAASGSLRHLEGVAPFCDVRVDASDGVRGREASVPVLLDSCLPGKIAIDRPNPRDPSSPSAAPLFPEMDRSHGY